MKLAKFIQVSSRTIVDEWATFALTLMPGTSVEDRRDHIVGMLQAIAADLETPQTAHDQAKKSKGTEDAHPASETAAHSHGTDRAATGYTPAQMVAEFRALRASVLRLWSAQEEVFDRESVDDVFRFNEAIDQLLAESLAQYTLGVDRAKDLFIGILGHDLRNPLGAIMMAASLITTQEGPDWRHGRIASRILTSSARMDRIIRDMIDLTRSRLGTGIPVAPKKMDLEVVCQQTVDEIVSFHPGCTVELETSGPLHGEWDSGRLAQALSNLVGNAQQHGAPGVPIQISARGGPDRVVISVHNAGRAIPQDKLGTIFDPFRQLESARKATQLSSMGLGLYIAKEIVVAHRGTIDVTSGEEGTTFTVTLPRAAESSPVAACAAG